MPITKEPKNRQSITIEANGNIRLGAVEAELEDIKPTIEQAIKTIPNLKIFLRAEGTVAHDQVRKVMAECAAGGVATSSLQPMKRTRVSHYAPRR